MNIINKKTLFVFLILRVIPLSGDEGYMKITLEKVNTIIVLYEGYIHESIMADIKGARRLWLGPEKTGIPEGRYYIDITDGDRHIKYSVINNAWIYDEINNRYLKCSVLSTLRGILLAYLYDEGYLDNLYKDNKQ
jgi:hypothetical protein